MDHQPITSLKSVRLAVAAPDFQAGLSFFVEELGFEVAMIAPAEDPTYAVLTLEGMTIALDNSPITAFQTTREYLLRVGNRIVPNR